jgi:phosphoribosylaminoimidazole (AIR) synthetase
MAEQPEIWIEAEEWPAGEWEPDDAVTDVVVTLGDGSRWVATFCAFAHLATLRAACDATGENLGGKYLWASDLILVDDTSRDSVAAVVADLIAAGDVPSAFSELTEDSRLPPE